MFLSLPYVNQFRPPSLTLLSRVTKWAKPNKNPPLAHLCTLEAQNPKPYLHDGHPLDPHLQGRPPDPEHHRRLARALAALPSLPQAAIDATYAHAPACEELPAHGCYLEVAIDVIHAHKPTSEALLIHRRRLKVHAPATNASNSGALPYPLIGAAPPLPCFAIGGARPSTSRSAAAHAATSSNSVTRPDMNSDTHANGVK